MPQINSNGKATQSNGAPDDLQHIWLWSPHGEDPPKKANARNKIQSPSSSFNDRAVGSNMAVILREPCEIKQVPTR